MLIPMPKGYEEEQTQTRSELDSTTTGNNEDFDRIREYLNVAPWYCVECGGKMFGRMTYCAFCKRERNK